MKWDLVFKGAAMGMAEVIPGVSGGTIAFITGIYERLINAIKSFHPSLIKTYKAEGLKSVWQKIDGSFLTFLLVGMAGGLIIGVFGITYLIETYPEPLWAFFFGLILASSVFVGAQVERWNALKVAVLFGGILIAYGITVLTPAGGSTQPLYLFLSGFLAISALILPGISGSFILLLMGMYTIVIPAIKDFLQNRGWDELMVIGIFGLGCVVGLATFSRVLSWLFKHYKESVFALLTGFMIGSLNKIWPWRNLEIVMSKSTGQTSAVTKQNVSAILEMDGVKVIKESNVLPSDYWMGQANITYVCVAFVLGLAIVYFLSRYDSEPHN